MGLQSSIFHRKDHPHALSVLGIIVENSDFPTTAVCPVCEETALNIYEDIVQTDLWLACTNCPAHGNIITFASAYWKIDAIAAVDKFKALGVNTRELDPEILAAIAKRAKCDAAADKFWEQAAAQLWTHSNDVLSVKFKDFGLSPEIPCQGLAGVVVPDQVGELCSVLSTAYPRRLRMLRPVLVFPYCDLPRHHSGFLLVQYQEEFEARRMFLPIYSARATRAPIDAGYYLLEQAVLAKHQAVKNAIFITDDPQWVLKAQTTQLRHGDGLLPLCASYAGREALTHGHIWPDVSRSRKFFYSARISPELISQTANGGGYVCTLSADGLPKPTQPAKTIKLLGKLYRSAVTWQKTLKHVFDNINEIAARSFAARLIIPLEKLRGFFANNDVVPPDVAEELLAKTPPIYFSSTDVTQYSTRIIARDGCWYTARNALITNCLPVIESIIHTEDDRYYAGYVKKQDKQIQFIERAKTIDSLGFLAYAERLMAAHGEHVIFVPQWNRRSHITAMTFYPPTIHHRRSKPGWDEITKEFYCGDYAVNLNGEIRALPYPELTKKKIFNLPDPDALAPPSVYELLTPTAENATVWSVFSAVLGNMLAPAFERDPRSMAIPADAFIATKELLQSLGIRHKELLGTSGGLRKSFTLNVSTADWPTMLLVREAAEWSATDKYARSTIVKYPNTAAIIRVANGTICPALSYGWQIINGPLHAPGFNYTAIPHVAAGYIQHALKNRAKFANRQKNLTEIVLADLHTWLAEKYNTTFNLAIAEKQIPNAGAETTWLMREINNAINSGHIHVLPKPRLSRQLANYIVRDNETWWLNRKAIDRYFNIVSGLLPNWMEIADYLSRNGLLRGEKTIHKTSGLLVAREWCDSFWTDYGDTAAKNIG